MSYIHIMSETRDVHCAHYSHLALRELLQVNTRCDATCCALNIICLSPLFIIILDFLGWYFHLSWDPKSCLLISSNPHVFLHESLSEPLLFHSCLSFFSPSLSLSHALMFILLLSLFVSVVSCPPPQNMINSHLKYKDLFYGSNATYTCDKSHYIIGGKSLAVSTCSSAKTWTSALQCLCGYRLCWTHFRSFLQFFSFIIFT